jgi:tRNA A-37 threonylcarbamoyl transferase component Bud32
VLKSIVAFSRVLGKNTQSAAQLFVAMASKNAFPFIWLLENLHKDTSLRVSVGHNIDIAVLSKDEVGHELQQLKSSKVKTALLAVQHDSLELGKAASIFLKTTTINDKERNLLESLVESLVTPGWPLDDKTKTTLVELQETLTNDFLPSDKRVAEHVKSCAPQEQQQGIETKFITNQPDVPSVQCLKEGLQGLQRLPDGLPDGQRKNFADWILESAHKVNTSPDKDTSEKLGILNEMFSLTCLKNTDLATCPPPNHQECMDFARTTFPKLEDVSEHLAACAELSFLVVHNQGRQLFETLGRFGGATTSTFEKGVDSAFINMTNKDWQFLVSFFAIVLTTPTPAWWNNPRGIPRIQHAVMMGSWPPRGNSPMVRLQLVDLHCSLFLLCAKNACHKRLSSQFGLPKQISIAVLLPHDVNQTELVSVFYSQVSRCDFGSIFGNKGESGLKLCLYGDFDTVKSNTVCGVQVSVFDRSQYNLKAHDVFLYDINSVHFHPQNKQFVESPNICGDNACLVGGVDKFFNMERYNKKVDALKTKDYQDQAQQLQLQQLAQEKEDARNRQLAQEQEDARNQELAETKNTRKRLGAKVQQTHQTDDEYRTKHKNIQRFVNQALHRRIKTQQEPQTTMYRDDAATVDTKPGDDHPHTSTEVRGAPNKSGLVEEDIAEVRVEPYESDQVEEDIAPHESLLTPNQLVYLFKDPGDERKVWTLRQIFAKRFLDVYTHPSRSFEKASEQALYEQALIDFAKWMAKHVNHPVQSICAGLFVTFDVFGENVSTDLDTWFRDPNAAQAPNPILSILKRHGLETYVKMYNLEPFIDGAIVYSVEDWMLLMEYGDQMFKYFDQVNKKNSALWFTHEIVFGRKDYSFGMVEKVRDGNNVYKVLYDYYSSKYNLSQPGVNANLESVKSFMCRHLSDTWNIFKKFHGGNVDVASIFFARFVRVKALYARHVQRKGVQSTGTTLQDAKTPELDGFINAMPHFLDHIGPYDSFKLPYGDTYQKFVLDLTTSKFQCDVRRQPTNTLRRSPPIQLQTNTDAQVERQPSSKGGSSPSSKGGSSPPVLECSSPGPFEKCGVANQKQFDAFVKSFKTLLPADQKIVSQCAKLCFVGIHKRAETLFVELGKLLLDSTVPSLTESQTQLSHDEQQVLLHQQYFHKGVKAVVDAMKERPGSAFSCLFPFVALVVVDPLWPSAKVKKVRANVFVYMRGGKEGRNGLRYNLFLLCAKKAALSLRNEVTGVEKQNVLATELDVSNTQDVDVFIEQVQQCAVASAFGKQPDNAESTPTLYLNKPDTVKSYTKPVCDVNITVRSKPTESDAHIQLVDLDTNSPSKQHCAFMKSPNMNNGHACIIGQDDEDFLLPNKSFKALRSILRQQAERAKRGLLDRSITPQVASPLPQPPAPAPQNRQKDKRQTANKSDTSRHNTAARRHQPRPESMQLQTKPGSMQLQTKPGSTPALKSTAREDPRPQHDPRSAHGQSIDNGSHIGIPGHPDDTSILHQHDSKLEGSDTRDQELHGPSLHAQFRKEGLSNQHMVGLPDDTHDKSYQDVLNKFRRDNEDNQTGVGAMQTAGRESLNRRLESRRQTLQPTQNLTPSAHELEQEQTNATRPTLQQQQQLSTAILPTQAPTSSASQPSQHPSSASSQPNQHPTSASSQTNPHPTSVTSQTSKEHRSAASQPNPTQKPVKTQHTNQPPSLNGLQDGAIQAKKLSVVLMPPLFVFDPNVHVEMLKLDGKKTNTTSWLAKNKDLLKQTAQFPGVEFSTTHGTTYDAAFYAKIDNLEASQINNIVAKLQEAARNFTSESFAYCSMVIMTKTSKTTHIRVLTLGRNPVIVYAKRGQNDLKLIKTYQTGKNKKDKNVLHKDNTQNIVVQGCVVGTPCIGRQDTFSDDAFDLEGRLYLLGSSLRDMPLRPTTTWTRAFEINALVPVVRGLGHTQPSKTAFIADTHDLEPNTTTVCAVFTGEVDYQAANWAVHAFPHVIASAVNAVPDMPYLPSLPSRQIHFDRATGQLTQRFARLIGTGFAKCVTSTDAKHGCIATKSSEDLVGKVQVVLHDDDYQEELAKVVLLTERLGGFIDVSQIALTMPTSPKQACKYTGDFPAVLDKCGTLVAQCKEGMRGALRVFLMPQGQSLPQTLSSQIKVDMCMELMMLNVCKLIHTDVKQQNFLMHDSKCKLIDFGFLTDFTDIDGMNRLYVESFKTTNANHSYALLQKDTSQDYVADFFDMYSLCKMLGLKDITKRIDNLDASVTWADVLRSVQDETNLEGVVRKYMTSLSSRSPDKKNELATKLSILLTGGMCKRTNSIMQRFKAPLDFRKYIVWAVLRDRMHEDKPRKARTLKPIVETPTNDAMEANAELSVIGDFEDLLICANSNRGLSLIPNADVSEVGDQTHTYAPPRTVSRTSQKQPSTASHTIQDPTRNESPTSQTPTSAASQPNQHPTSAASRPSQPQTSSVSQTNPNLPNSSNSSQTPDAEGRAHQPLPKSASQPERPRVPIIASRRRDLPRAHLKPGVDDKLVVYAMPPLFTFRPQVQLDLLNYDNLDERQQSKLLKTHATFLRQTQHFVGVDFASSLGVTYDSAFYAQCRIFEDSDISQSVHALQDLVNNFQSESHASMCMVIVTPGQTDGTRVDVLSLGPNPVLVFDERHQLTHGWESLGLANSKYTHDNKTYTGSQVIERVSKRLESPDNCDIWNPTIGATHSRALHDITHDKVTANTGRVFVLGGGFFNSALSDSEYTAQIILADVNTEPKLPSRTAFIVDLDTLPQHKTTICCVVSSTGNYHVPNWAVTAIPDMIAEKLFFTTDFKLIRGLKHLRWLPQDVDTGVLTQDVVATLIGKGGFKCVMSTDVMHTCVAKLPDIDLHNKVQVVLTKKDYDSELSKSSLIRVSLKGYVDFRGIVLVITNESPTCLVKKPALPVYDECKTIRGTCLKKYQKEDVLQVVVIDKGEACWFVKGGKLDKDLAFQLCVNIMIFNACKLIHGDVKTGNVIMHNRRCKLIDFGLTQKFENLSQFFKRLFSRKHSKARNHNHSSRLLKATPGEMDFVVDYFDMYGICYMFNLDDIMERIDALDPEVTWTNVLERFCEPKPTQADFEDTKRDLEAQKRDLEAQKRDLEAQKRDLEAQKRDLEDKNRHLDLEAKIRDLEAKIRDLDLGAKIRDLDLKAKICKALSGCQVQYSLFTKLDKLLTGGTVKTVDTIMNTQNINPEQRVLVVDAELYGSTFPPYTKALKHNSNDNTLTDKDSVTSGKSTESNPYIHHDPDKLKYAKDDELVVVFGFVKDHFLGYIQGTDENVPKCIGWIPETHVESIVEFVDTEVQQQQQQQQQPQQQQPQQPQQPQQQQQQQQQQQHDASWLRTIRFENVAVTVKANPSTRAGDLVAQLERDEKLKGCDPVLIRKGKPLRPGDPVGYFDDGDIHVICSAKLATKLAKPTLFQGDNNLDAAQQTLKGVLELVAKERYNNTKVCLPIEIYTFDKEGDKVVLKDTSSLVSLADAKACKERLNLVSQSEKVDPATKTRIQTSLDSCKNDLDYANLADLEYVNLVLGNLVRAATELPKDIQDNMRELVRSFEQPSTHQVHTIPEGGKPGTDDATLQR